MKAKLRSVIISLTLLIIYSIACKKEASHIELIQLTETTEIKSKINTWIGQYSQNKSVSNFNLIDSNYKNLDWKSIEIYNIKSSNIAIVSIHNNLNKAVFILNNNLSVKSGSIFLFKNINKKINLNDIIVKMIKNDEIIPFNGKVIITTFENTILQENIYADYKLYSVKAVNKVKKILKNQSLNLSSGIVCTDWYWVTRINGVVVLEEYLFTTCSENTDLQCTGSFVIENEALILRKECGGSSGGDDNGIFPDQICTITFSNFQAITSNGMSYALNVAGFKFVNGTTVNSINAYINVQNYISNNAMNNAQPAALPEFLPPGLAYKSPLEIYLSIPLLKSLYDNGEISYKYNTASQEYGYSFSQHAYAEIVALASDWASTNTFFYAPNPASNPLAEGVFIKHFQAILQSLIPGSRVSSALRDGVQTNSAKYFKNGICQ